MKITVQYFDSTGFEFKPQTFETGTKTWEYLSDTYHQSVDAEEKADSFVKAMIARGYRCVVTEETTGVGALKRIFG